MSLEQIETDLTRKIVKSDAKIVVLDIERMKGQALIEFWDLSDFKNRRIHADDVTLWPRTICVSWKTYGSDKVRHVAEWQTGGRERMLERIWKVYDEADVVVGHNIQAFDTKKLQNEWFELGWAAPFMPTHVDTLKIARQQLGMESNTLDALCKRAGVVSKSDRFDVELARAACAGDKVAQKRVLAYCDGDVVAGEALYDALRGRIPNHPHVIIGDADTIACTCGSEDLAPAKPMPGPSGRIFYKAWRCRNCGQPLRDTRQHARTARTVGVR